MSDRQPHQVANRQPPLVNRGVWSIGGNKALEASYRWAIAEAVALKLGKFDSHIRDVGNHCWWGRRSSRIRGFATWLTISGTVNPLLASYTNQIHFGTPISRQRPSLPI